MMFEMESNPLGHFLAGILDTWHPIPSLSCFLLFLFLFFLLLLSFIFPSSFSFSEDEETKRKKKSKSVCGIVSWHHVICGPQIWLPRIGDFTSTTSNNHHQFNATTRHFDPINIFSDILSDGFSRRLKQIFDHDLYKELLFDINHILIEFFSGQDWYVLKYLTVFASIIHTGVSAERLGDIPLTGRRSSHQSS